jgi:hypothetical protein
LFYTGIIQELFLCPTTDIHSLMKQGGWDGVTCNRHGEMRNAYKILVGKPDGKRSYERPRRRLEDNIKVENKVWDRDCIQVTHSIVLWWTP